MVNPNKEAHDIIIELAQKAEDDINLNDPSTQKLIYELNAVARFADFNALDEKRDQGYYSVKDVAELFDVNKQTVYKWIAEEKIEYKEDNSPGKTQRKGYQIPKSQFQTENEMNEVDPTFSQRRKEETEDIPNTDFDSGNVVLPKDVKESLNHDDIKRDFKRQKNEHGE
ncbi:helix-turn-helix domain-containing protein [Virgibacillus necropolis]|uniref:helix-turn-helix domain-containing protein n=1 Tax=Virgibacillus necropolis TaxID=163877 RepID=UPI00384AF0CF